MILMVVAVACGLAASYMTSRLLAERSPQQTNENKVSVVVAKQKVSPMILIKEPNNQFELKEFPEGLAPKKALKSLDDVKDQRLNKAVSEEEIITADHLLNKDQAGMSAELPPGTRAVAIKVNPESLVGGFVLPKTRVDILFTLRGGPTEAQTKLLLQDMLVLAVDQTKERDPSTQTQLANTVTLAAKPQEAERLALASSLGELRLLLRGLGDNERIRLAAAKYNDLDKPIREGLADEPIVASSAAAPPPIPSLPKLDPLPPPTAPVQVVEAPKAAQKDKEKPKVEAKAEPEPEAAKTHTMVIINGEFVQKAVFIEDPQEGWKNGGVNREEGPPAKKLETGPGGPAGRPARN
jgi:pilus assembly protein CpaB